MTENGPHGLKCEKFCVPESGNEEHGQWLRTRIRWLKKGDIIRIVRDEEVKEKPTYVIVGDKPFWSTAHKCWDVHMNIYEK
jgi:hypothetical protein